MFSCSKKIGCSKKISCSKKNRVYDETYKQTKSKPILKPRLNPRLKHKLKQIKSKPTPKSVIIDDALTSKEFTELFLDEELACGICDSTFSLRQNELVATCGGCYKFLHCGIAGKCVGPNCNFIIKGTDYRESWCINCVPKTIVINIENTGSVECDCLCRVCLDDPSTSNKFKRKI